MPDFKLPLSGDVNQAFKMFFNPIGNQVGLFNINLGNSSDTTIEAQVLSDVASYGKQLGRIGEALIVLLEHANLPQGVNLDYDKAIKDVKAMLNDIADVKERHHATHIVRPK